MAELIGGLVKSVRNDAGALEYAETSGPRASEIELASFFLHRQKVEDLLNLPLLLARYARFDVFRQMTSVVNLTPAEKRVARLARDGKKRTEIATELGVSPHSVKHHLNSIYKKYGIHGGDDYREKQLRLAAALLLPLDSPLRRAQ